MASNARVALKRQDVKNIENCESVLRNKTKQKRRVSCISPLYYSERETRYTDIYFFSFFTPVLSKSPTLLALRLLLIYVHIIPPCVNLFVSKMSLFYISVHLLLFRRIRDVSSLKKIAHPQHRRHTRSLLFSRIRDVKFEENHIPIFDDIVLTLLSISTSLLYFYLRAVGLQIRE